MKCQICRKDTYVPILSLGNQPLANKYPANKTELKKERKLNKLIDTLLFLTR